MIQVGAALERLDNGVGGGRSGDSTVLRAGELLGLDYVFVQAHALRRGDGQQVAVFHDELNAGVTHGAYSFAFLQLVTDFELTTDALGVNGKNGAITSDGGDGSNSNLGHDDLRLNKQMPGD